MVRVQCPSAALHPSAVPCQFACQLALHLRIAAQCHAVHQNDARAASFEEEFSIHHVTAQNEMDWLTIAEKVNALEDLDVSRSRFQFAALQSSTSDTRM